MTVVLCISVETILVEILRMLRPMQLDQWMPGSATVSAYLPYERMTACSCVSSA